MSRTRPDTAGEAAFAAGLIADDVSVRVLVALYEATTETSLPRCGRWRKTHDWAKTAWTSDDRGALTGRTVTCQRCGTAFSVSAHEDYRTWNVRTGPAAA